MDPLVSRTGRELQFYVEGVRQVVGCIPYRYKSGKRPSLNKIFNKDELEILVISAQKGDKMLFPKGGWETDESKEDAASRETVEEAGVRGYVEPELGKWSFSSRSHECEVYMFPLLVKEELDIWPEKDIRIRKWMTVSQAREVCKHGWMKEALDALVHRFSQMKEALDALVLSWQRKEALRALLVHCLSSQWMISVLSKLLLWRFLELAGAEQRMLQNSKKMERRKTLSFLNISCTPVIVTPSCNSNCKEVATYLFILLKTHKVELETDHQGRIRNRSSR